MKLSVTTHLSRGLQSRGRLDHKSNEKLDVTRLRARLGEKPRTKAGQVRQAWPEIKALFEAGHSLKDIWVWLNEIGIEIGYARLSHYTGQLKRRDRSAARAEVGPPTPETRCVNDSLHRASTGDASREIRTGHQGLPSANDPLANIREREDRPLGFQYNPDPDVKKLI